MSCERTLQCFPSTDGALHSADLHWKKFRTATPPVQASLGHARQDRKRPRIQVEVQLLCPDQLLGVTANPSPPSSVQILRLANPLSRHISFLKRKWWLRLRQSSLSCAAGKSNSSTTWPYKKAARRRKTWSLGQGSVSAWHLSHRGDVTLRCHCLPSKARELGECRNATPTNPAKMHHAIDSSSQFIEIGARPLGLSAALYRNS